MAHLRRFPTESYSTSEKPLSTSGKQSIQVLARRIPLMRPIIDTEMMEAALRSLQNEKLVMGESVYKFEEEFAKYCGTRNAISTSSGTAALQIALQALGIGPGDEVLTTPFSFIATANAILHAYARPQFIDVDSFDLNMSANGGERVTKETKAIMPVHLYGRPCKMSEFQEMVEDKGLRLVEDACQAHGAEYQARRVGSFGDVGCFSFYSSKNMTVGGDGGMIVTNDDDASDAAKSLRDCGRISSSKYAMSRIGYTSRLNTVNAAVGRVQLRRLDEWNQSRRRIAMLYKRNLEGIPEVKLPPADEPNVKSVYHLFVIRSRRRDQIKEQLERRGIETGVHYPIPIHLQTPYRKMFSYSEGSFPESERAAEEVLSLPIHPNLGDEEVHYICEKIRETVHS